MKKERKKRKLTPEIEQKIIDLNAQGKSQREIVKLIGNISRQIIKDVYKKHNLIGLPNGKLNKTNIDEIIKLYNNGATTLELGKRFNVSISAIARTLKKNNIDISRGNDIDEKSGKLILELRNKGNGTRNLTKLTGFTRSVIKLWLYKNGIEKNSHPPPKEKIILKEKRCTICGEIRPIINFKLINGGKYNHPNCNICRKLRKNISTAIAVYFNSNRQSKHASILKFLPYSINELKQHLESLFDPWMNWNNYGMYNSKTWDDNNSLTWTWNLDHIIPHSNFKYTSIEDEKFKKCWSLENLRPYSAKQNQHDGATKIRHI